MVRFVDHELWDLKRDQDYFTGPEVGSSLLCRSLGKPGPTTKIGDFGNAYHMAVFQPDMFEERVRHEPEHKALREMFTPRVAIWPESLGNGRSDESKLNRRRHQADNPGIEYLPPSKYEAALKRDLREQWAEANRGKLIITESEYEACFQIRDAVQRHPVIRRQKLWEGAVHEQAIRCRDSVTGLTVRIRTDWRRSRTNLDLKGTQNPQPSAFRKTVLANWYHLQAALYCDVLRDWTSEPQRWGWIAVRKTYPFHVAFTQAEDEWLYQGERLYSAALVVVAKQRERGEEIPPHWCTGVNDLGDVPRSLVEETDDHVAYAEGLLE